MKAKLAIAITVFILIGSSVDTRAQTNENESLKGWTAQNSIDIRYIFDNLSPGKSVLPSPDGRYFFSVTCRGNLKSDRTEFKFNIYNAKEVIAALNNKKNKGNVYVKPIRTMKLSTVIFLNNLFTGDGKLRWTDDSQSIVFTGTDAFAGGIDTTDKSVLYKFNISDGSLQLIKSIDNTMGYIWTVSNCSKDASTITFKIKSSMPGEKLLYKYPAAVVPHYELLPLFFGYTKDKLTDYIYHQGKTTELPENNGSWLSADGSRIIICQPRVDYPYSWSQFYKTTKKEFMSPWGIEDNDDISINEFNRFMIIDTDNPGNFHPVINAPLGISTSVGSKLAALTKVLWTNDNRYAILVNSALPIKENQLRPDTMAYIVASDLENGNYEILSPLIEQQDTVSNVSWNNDGNELLISYENGKDSKTISYTRKGSKWIRNNSPAIEKLRGSSLPDDIKVFVRQDINTPSMLIASNGKNEIYLTEADTSLQNVYIAPTKTITWQMPDGRILTGGLTLPKGYEKLKPLPLIVENYGYDSSRFNPDGDGGYVKQSFVANGYAVLKIDISVEDLDKKYGTDEFGNNRNKKSSLEEGSHYVEMVDAVVKMFVDNGLVDPNKVGMIGFSRGGYETLYTITHPGKIKLAAAIDIDGWSGTFFNDLINSRFGSKYLYHGTFWENKKEWLEHEPVFNVDKAKTPLLIEVHTSNEDPNFGLIQYADLMGAFRENKKPLETLVLPKANHGLSRPQEIYYSIVNKVDWMNFWLKGQEDPDPTKVEMYRRWRKLRKLQESGS